MNRWQQDKKIHDDVRQSNKKYIHKNKCCPSDHQTERTWEILSHSGALWLATCLVGCGIPCGNAQLLVMPDLDGVDDLVDATGDAGNEAFILRVALEAIHH